MAHLATIPQVPVAAGQAQGVTPHFLSTAGRSSVESPVPHGRTPLWELLGPGNLVELTGRAPGKLSTLARLVARAQGQGEQVAWVAPRDGASFYPPDFARVGIDLDSLVMVRIPRAADMPMAGANNVPRGNETALAGANSVPRHRETALAGAHGVVRATEVLLRSGAFGLVILDLSHEVPRGELSWQSRLSGLVRMHEARLVLLTSSRPEDPSLGPLVSLRVAPELRITARTGRAVLGQRLLKSKLGHMAEPSPDVRALPAGLV